MFFDVQKFLILVKSKMSIFSSVARAFGVIKETITKSSIIKFSMFPSKSFIVLAFMLESFDPFWINFYMVLG